MDFIKFIISAVCAGFLTAGIAGLIADKDFGAFTVFIAIGIFLGSFYISWMIIENIFNTTKKATDVISEKVKEQKEIINLQNATNLEIKKYQEAKHSYQYFSNSRLLSLYAQYQTHKISSNLEQLALEEELVKRRLIDHSPMHEKLYLIKKEFFD